MNLRVKTLLSSPSRIGLIMTLIVVLTWAGVFGNSPSWKFFLTVLSPTLIFGSAIAALFQKRWRAALIGLGLVLPGFIVLEVFLAFSLRGTTAPPFGANIKLPANMQADGVSEQPELNLSHSDPDAKKILNALQSNNQNDSLTKIDIKLGSLETALGDREALVSYLSASPKWAVREEYGQQFAVRRFVSPHKNWEYSLHGFASRGDLEKSISNPDYFQIRVRLLLNGKAVSKARRDEVTFAKLGEDQKELAIFDPASGMPGYRSTLLITDASENFAIEIYEQSPSKPRLVTSVLLNLLKEELAGSLENQFGLPSGTQAVSVAGGYGIYKIYGLVNSGEPGWVTLRVFEATTNTELSASEVLQRSKERIGWSKRSADKFYYQSEVTIYEGSWGTFYPARFEVWFSPDSGEPARKLVQRIYLIEGWTR